MHQSGGGAGEAGGTRPFTSFCGGREEESGDNYTRIWYRPNTLKEFMPTTTKQTSLFILKAFSPCLKPWHGMTFEGVGEAPHP